MLRFRLRPPLLRWFASSSTDSSGNLGVRPPRKHQDERQNHPRPAETAPEGPVFALINVSGAAFQSFRPREKLLAV